MSLRYSGRCLAVGLQSGIWSVLTKEGSVHLAGATDAGAGRKSTFFRLPKSWKLLSQPTTSRGSISSYNQHQSTEGQSVNKVMYTPFFCYRLVAYLGIYLNGGSLLVILVSYKVSQVITLCLRQPLIKYQVNLPSFLNLVKGKLLIGSH